MGIIRKASRGGRAALVLALVGLLAVLALTGSRVVSSQSALASPTDAVSPSPADIASPPVPSAVATSLPRTYPTAIRNVVVLLADDLDTAAFNQVKRLKALHARGLTLTNMVVTDSLCCPSRASILRSQYVHNHGVLSNLVGSGGGWATFAANGDEKDCLPVWLHAAGVQTAYIGKYLNGYGEDGDPTAIPAGWDRWFSPTTKSGMYRGYGYTVNDNGSLKTYAVGKEDFLPDVVTGKSVDFLRTARSPFYLQINSTSPHDPAPVAERHQGDDGSVRLPRTASFNDAGTNAAAWRSERKAISKKKLARLETYWRQRIQSTESFADTVDAVTQTLEAKGLLDSTLVVVTSDNGFHVANRRLPPGKRAPYREDTVVPTILIGPGITAGARINAMTSMIDLGPTITELLGATAPSWVDGRSLTPWFSGGSTAPWRTGVISESLGRSTFGDPDYQKVAPPKYVALRTQKWLYVEYADGTRELFDGESDPQEIDNVYSSTEPGIRDALSAHLKALSTCAGDTCRTADTWSTAAES